MTAFGFSLDTKQEAALDNLENRYHADASWWDDYGFWKGLDLSGDPPCEATNPVAGCSTGVRVKQTYTLDIERRFAAHAIAIVAPIEDIWSDSDSVYGVSIELETFQRTLDFSLKCTPDQLAVALNNAAHDDPYAFIIHVDGVRKVLLEPIIQEPGKQDGDSPREIALRVSDRAIVTGSCIAVERLGPAKADDSRSLR